MLQVIVLILIILILIFIIYTYYSLQEKVPEVIYKSNKTLIKEKTQKFISYYSECLQINNNKVFVVYYNLPINCIYWSIGIFENSKCVNSINMGKYQATEMGDTLAVIIGNNYTSIKAAKREIDLEHNTKYSYKRLMHESIQIDNDFYIRFDSYSNRFIETPKMVIKEYVFDNIIPEPYFNVKLEESIVRNCESKYLFEKSKEGFINDKCKLIETYTNSNEDNIQIECLTNKTAILEITKRDDKPEFKLVAVDHFKSRAALHSHVIFYNADNHDSFAVEITGEISDRINQKDSITVRRITFKVPESINRFYVVEYIYYDFVSGNKINPETVIPIELYKIIKN